MKKSLFLIITVFICGVLHAQTTPRIAVLPFEAVGVSENDALVAYRLFETALVQTDKFTVLEQNQVEEILDAQAYALSGCTDETCAVEIGKLLSAEQIFLGSLFHVGDDYIVTVKLIDIALGKHIKAEKISFKSTSDLSNTADSIAAKFVEPSEEEKNQIKRRDFFIEYDNRLTDLEAEMLMVNIMQLDQFENKLNSFTDELAQIEFTFPMLEERAQVLFDNIRTKQNRLSNSNKVSRLKNQLIVLESEYKKAHANDRRRGRARVLFGILSLGSFGGAGTCWYLGDQAYNNYNNAEITLPAEALRDEAERYERIKFTSGIAGGLFSILFLANTTPDEAPPIEEQINAITAEIAALETSL